MSEKIKTLLRSDRLKDTMLNIIASLVLSLASQLIIYPFLSRNFTATEYGQILTTMGIINTFGIAIGNSLNNTRLLVNKEYEDNNIYGDFTYLFIRNISVFGLILLFILLLFIELSLEQAILCGILMALIAYRGYFSVDYRIFIDYKKIVYANMLGAAGYLVSIFFVKFWNIWIIPFILSELFSCIYIYNSSKISREPKVRTDFYKKTSRKYYQLLSSYFVSNIMTYMDRFIIYPLLGSGIVSIYTVAAFLGKSLGIVVGPITGVMLTYYSKEKELSIPTFVKRVVLFFVSSMGLFIFILIFGKFIMKILFPNLINEALPYFAIANLSSIILVFGNMIQPTVLRFCDSRWQLIIQTSYLIVYLLSAFIGIYFFDLLGFCIAVLIANIFKSVMMIIIVLKTKRN